MNNLEIKRKKLDLARIQMARQEMEFKIEERLEEIERLKLNIEVQSKRETELEQELKGN